MSTRVVVSDTPPHVWAQQAWEEWNPEKVSKPEYDVERQAWVSGYLACLDDMKAAGCRQ